MEGYLEGKLKRRWDALELRTNQISDMLDELKEFDELQNEVSIKNTSIYILLQKEMDLLTQEQSFIESLWQK